MEGVSCGQAQGGWQRQPHGTDQQRNSGLNGGQRRRLTLHRSQRADPERLHGKLQWPAVRRVPERDPVHLARPARVALEDRHRDYNIVRARFRIGRLTSVALRQLISLDTLIRIL